MGTTPESARTWRGRIVGLLEQMAGQTPVVVEGDATVMDPTLGGKLDDLLAAVNGLRDDNVRLADGMQALRTEFENARGSLLIQGYLALVDHHVTLPDGFKEQVESVVNLTLP